LKKWFLSITIAALITTTFTTIHSDSHSPNPTASFSESINTMSLSLDQMIAKRSEFGFSTDESQVTSLMSQQYLSKEFGFYLTPTEEQELINRIQEQDVKTDEIRNLYSLDENYLGMYIDQASGGTINIGFKENTTPMLEASSINSFLPIKTFEAEYSEKEMEDAANLLSSNLSIVTELIPSLLYINVDFINQEIQIGTKEEVNDADGLIVQKISEITRQNKNLFKIVTDPTSKTEDNLRTDRIRPLQGGLTIDSAPSTAGNCSTGYSALDSSGNPYIMTAAHCWYKQPGTGIYQSDAYIGTISSIAHYGNNVDAAAIRVSSTNLLSNQVYNETTRLTALQVPGNDVIGEVVCISGRNRGETNPCGTLQGKSASAFWEIMDNGVLTKVWFDNLRAATYPTSGGDSGGTIFRGNTLKGINKGTLPASGFVYSVYSHVGNVTNRLGLTPVTW
jgi:hypothetical protein